MGEYSNKIAEALARASEADKIELAHFLANNLEPEGQEISSARVRLIVAALDRFSAPRQGEQF